MRRAGIISIHTPTKGATFTHDYLHTYTNISIHTPTKGATVDTNKIPEHLKISIHTPTKGATRGHVRSMMQSSDFNPHSHEGSDCRIVSNVMHERAFQSTLPRRERPLNHFQQSFPLPHFNPHSHEGSDSIISPMMMDLANFNPHSHEGSDVNH